MIGVEILDTRDAMIQYAIKVIMTIVIKLQDEGVRQVRSQLHLIIEKTIVVRKDKIRQSFICINQGAQRGHHASLFQQGDEKFGS